MSFRAFNVAVFGNCSALALLALFIVTVAAPVARPAIPMDSAEQFFTHVADQLLQQQIGKRLREIQIAPSNQYDTVVHRILQITANIYDATSTNRLPTVFRPMVESRSNGIFLAGFTNDHRVSTLGPWLEANTNNLPLVIGVKKGLPNFNEFTMRSDILVQRKLQLTRASTAPGARPTGTNQMYMLSLSNCFGVEAWNSYDVSRAGRYAHPLTITVSNQVTAVLSNAAGVRTNMVSAVVASTNVPALSWSGGVMNGFIVPLSESVAFLKNAAYRFAENHFETENTNTFEQLPGYPLPEWVFAISNRLTFLISEPDGEDARIVDFAFLHDGHLVDLHRDLIASINPYQGIPGIPAALGNVWNTNRTAAGGPTMGIRSQMDISLGNMIVPISDWRAFALTLFGNEADKLQAIDSFRVFCGFGPLTTNAATNLGISMVAPFNPAARLSVVRTWEVDDPLVHSLSSDLVAYAQQNDFYLKPLATPTNIPPSSLGRLNGRYSPWGGNPTSPYESPWEYDRSIKDPGIYSSDDWNFPSGVTLGVGWLGRVHRGTPWQTIYLKNEAASRPSWTNQSPTLQTHPTNDWRLAGWFARARSTNPPNDRLSVNATTLASWDAVFTGLTVLSNDLPAIFHQPPHFKTNMVVAGAPQTETIVAGINRTRASMRGQYFAGISALLSVPELSTASPWLNYSVDQLKWGLNDEAYEILPAQLLSRLRADPIGYALPVDDGIELRFEAWDGEYQVEGSNDFVTWETVSSPHAAANGSFSITVPRSGDRQFFRARLRP